MTEAQFNSVLSSVRALLIAIGGWLLANGYATSVAYKGIEMAIGLSLVIGPSLWGVWVAISNARAKKEITTTAVNAGLKLAASGNMLDVHGDKVPCAPGTPPLPATPEAAAKIVQDYGPA